MLKIEENVDVKKYTTLKIGGQFRYFVEINNIDEIRELCVIAQEDEKYKDIPFFILGGGSNIVFSDGLLDVLAIKVEIKGFEIIKEEDDFVEIKIGAGENWDEIVEKTVRLNFSGLEALSAIPGTVGATPVQNVGAYGSEVKDTIVEVEVFDLKDKKIKILSNSDCNFKYRDSVFKGEEKGRYLITRVTYRLLKGEIPIPAYWDITKYFEEKGITKPTLMGIREAIIEIRNKKLPNPKEVPNVGSFFKNPIVDNKIASEIKEKFPDVKLFPVNENLTKIPAGWLIENAGLKGKSFGNVSIYEKNALVLVNKNDATKEDLMKAKNEIVRIVKEKFGIILEQEPEII
ncbi:MAG: UDP-N-acetylmuramate dehydrogenase [Candidatus Pacebacteria bacterium]|nr:UDP-N-acetylmuramate dehydrogenase [Candidatus Paceibacterota bacterium]